MFLLIINSLTKYGARVNDIFLIFILIYYYANQLCMVLA